MSLWQRFLSKQNDHRNLLLFGKELNLILSRSIWNFISPLVKSAAVILDVGCGTGTLIYNISKQMKPNTIVVGLEMQRRRCEMALLKTQGEFICADALHMPFANETVSMVFSTMVIEHVDDKMLLHEICRTLKDGGIFILTTVIRGEGAKYFYKDGEARSLLAPDHLREYSSEQEILELIKSYGFVIKASIIYPFRLSLPTAFLSTLYKLFPTKIFEIAATTDLVSIIRTRLTVLIPRYYFIEMVAKKHHVPLNQSEVGFGQRLETEAC